MVKTIIVERRSTNPATTIGLGKEDDFQANSEIGPQSLSISVSSALNGAGRIKQEIHPGIRLGRGQALEPV